MTETAPPKSKLKQVRILLWVLVILAIAGSAAIWFFHRASVNPPQTQAKTSFGGPFTLVGADGRPFASSRLAGKPYAIYFGFTRCGDVCPTTLQRLVKKDMIGWGYTLFLPWGSYRPNLTKVHLALRYDPEKGPPLFAEPSSLIVDHSEGPAVRTTSATIQPGSGQPLHMPRSTP